MQPIRRTDQVSKTMFDVIQKSIVQHREITNQIKKANEVPIVDNLPIEEPTSIPLSDAMASGRFTYRQFGLYKEADTDSELGRIWVKKEIDNPKTGQKEEWLVVYTNDEEELIRQITNAKLKEVLATQPRLDEAKQFVLKALRSSGSYVDNTGKKTVDASEMAEMQQIVSNAKSLEDLENILYEYGGWYETDAARAMGKYASSKIAAQPNPKDIPIAQGIKSKNITIDESGASGTAKVTVEFTDVDQGLKFYQEDIAGGNKAEAPADEEQKTPAPDEEEESADKPPVPAPATPAPKGQGPQIAPGPMPQMGQASLKSDGLKKEAYDGFPGEFSQGVGSEDDDMMAQDAFGQMLMSGDRVKDEAGRKGIIETIVDQDNARVKWDESDLAEELPNGEFSVGDSSIPDDFAPGVAVEVVPTMSLTKWANTTLRKMTKGGSQIMDIIKNVYPNGVKYSFVNEGGYEVALPITNDLRTGAQIQRPDTKQVARVGNFIVHRFADKNVIADEILADMDLEIPGTVEDATVVAKKKWSPPWLDKKDKDDEDDKDGDDTKDDEGEDPEMPSTSASLVNDLVKEALDVSDQVAPMSWKSDGGETAPGGAGPSLPPKQDLQPGQNGNPPDPNATTNAQPVYDSAKGQAPSFQTTVNPDDRSVTVKFVENQQQQNLDKAVQDNTQANPAMPPATTPPAAPQPGVGQGQAPEFDDLNSPNQF